MVHFGAFWALVLMLYSIRRVKQSRKAVLCANCQLVSYLTWQTSRTCCECDVIIVYMHDRRKQANQLYNRIKDYHGKLQLTLEYTEKTTGTTLPLYKKERERRSRAFPSDSNPDLFTLTTRHNVVKTLGKPRFTAEQSTCACTCSNMASTGRIICLMPIRCFGRLSSPFYSQKIHTSSSHAERAVDTSE